MTTKLAIEKVANLGVDAKFVLAARPDGGFVYVPVMNTTNNVGTRNGKFVASIAMNYKNFKSLSKEEFTALSDEFEASKKIASACNKVLAELNATINV